MGNKNSKRPHVNNGKFKKCKQPQRWEIQQESGEGSSSGSDNQDTATVHVAVDGARIVNIEQLGKYTKELSRHVAQCEENTGSVAVLGEKRDGLASILSTECTGCGYKINLKTSPKVKALSG